MQPICEARTLPAMRIALLTTETLHHAHFLRALVPMAGEVLVFRETGSVSFPYETAHPFEAERETLERGRWFGGEPARLSDFAETRPVEHIDAAAEGLASFAPMITLVFGTRRLAPETIRAAGPMALNLHGGDPERYRGLDTHLWAIWHGDFADCVTTLHRLAPGLDAGRIISCLPVPLSPGMPLAALRAANTEVCIDLVGGVLSKLQRGAIVADRAQRAAGRYYSAMPAPLKAQCVNRFERYTAGLA